MRVFYLVFALGLAGYLYISVGREIRKEKARHEAEGPVPEGRSASRRAALGASRGMQLAAIASAITAVVLYPLSIEDALYFSIVLGVSMVLFMGSVVVLWVRTWWISRKYGRDAIREPPDDRPRLDPDHVSSLPPPGPAMNDPATQRAMGRYWHGTLGITIVGIAVLAATIAGLEYYDENLPGLLNGLFVVAFSASAVIVFVAVFAVPRALLMRRRLRRTPWVARRCRFALVPVGNSEAALLLLLHEDGTDDTLLQLSTVRWRAKALSDCDRREVWIAGDPRGSVVVTAPGVGILQVAKRPRWTWWRNRMLKHLKDKLREG